MNTKDFEKAKEIAELLSDYYDNGKVRILAILAASLGYRLVKLDKDEE